MKTNNLVKYIEQRGSTYTYPTSRQVKEELYRFITLLTDKNIEEIKKLLTK